MKKNSIWNVMTAHLWLNKDSRYLGISERPVWAILVETFGGEILPRLCFHAFCCNQPEWTWKLRWGPRDEYGIADKSLGHLMFMFGQWSGCGFGAFKQEREIARIPVDEEWIREHYPDAGWPFTDDDDSRPGDGGCTISL